MVVCVESYVGRHGGHEGVKLEEQLLITESGSECLSRYPRDGRLTSSQAQGPVGSGSPPSCSSAA